MAYTTGTIASVLPRLNADYFLPAVQREFVWKPDQILNLVDSLLKGYPTTLRLQASRMTVR